MTKHDKTIIGCIESIALPDLAINELNVRVDTGAKTSSLHVDNIKKINQDGIKCVSFDIHPDIHNVDSIVNCCAPICDIRKVKSSNGTSEQRYVIETMVTLGEQTWPIQITLTDRSDMSYLMLFGREAISGRFLVDPSKVYLAGR